MNAMKLIPLAVRTRAYLPLVCFVAMSAAAGCARNPVTGEMQLALISEAQEIQMGQQAAQEVEQSLGLVDDPALQAYVTAIGTRMAAASERPDLPWRFGVVDDPTPNAFALPGGPIYITRGMMNLMATEAQLASVLGHEIGHVTARHHVTSLSRAQLAQIGLGVGGMLFPQLEQLGGLAGAGLQLLFLQHGRDAERQADDLGFDYTLEHGYDVREMANVFATLDRLGGEQRSAVPTWLMTHPAPGDRVEAVRQRLQTAQLPAQPVIGTQPYLERIDGLTYGENPRNGFFRDGLFLHPDLRFQLALPEQWQRQNLSHAVMAMSPQQNAAIQLTLSDEGSASAAAQRFLSQPGVQVGQTGRQTVNGLSAVLATFQAQTQQQQQLLQGIIAFIEHGGRVYQVIGFAPAEAYGGYDRVFQQSLRSFAPVTDPQVLNVQPDRISIVRTTDTMTLAQFGQRYPSAIPIEELAVINQIADPNAPIPGGTLLKRVVPG